MLVNDKAENRDALCSKFASQFAVRQTSKKRNVYADFKNVISRVCQEKWKAGSACCFEL